MKKITEYIILFLAAVLSMSACDDFFDKEPVDRINASSFLVDETELKLYADGLIDSSLPGFTDVTIGNDAYTDLCATISSTTLYRPGEYDATKSSGWSYSSFAFLRNVNYMIENMTKAKGNVSEAVYNHYMGVARFWRAYAHWTKVETFGNTIWLDHVISEDDSLMYVPRQDREYVMHNVIRDLQFAAENCSSASAYVTASRVYVNKWVATAMLSKVALFEASYRKFHSVNPSTNVTWNNKYETSDDLYRIAASAAKSIMDSKVFSLHPDYSELFLSTAIPTDEVIWSRQADASIEVKHGTTIYYIRTSAGLRYSPTKELIDMYLTTDGTPVIDDTLTPDAEFVGRDKRLSASILGPGHTYTDGSGSTSLKGPDFSYTLTGYAFVKWVIEQEQNYTFNNDGNSVPILRYGEVLLNYAEAQAELGLMTEDIWNETIGLLRQRAGVTSIYPGSASYVEDSFLKEYYSEDSDGPVSLSNTILEIRRERAVELLMEWGNRHRDLRRWNMGNLIAKRYNNQGWRGMYVSSADVQNGFTINGQKYTISIGGKASSTQIAVANSGANSTWSLTDGDHGYLVYNYKLEWENKMYTYPIPTSALNLSPQLGQNYGWK